jgi:hypothetical protein
MGEKDLNIIAQHTRAESVNGERTEESGKLIKMSNFREKRDLVLPGFSLCERASPRLRWETCPRCRCSSHSSKLNREWNSIHLNFYTQTVHTIVIGKSLKINNQNLKLIISHPIAQQNKSLDTCVYFVSLNKRSIDDDKHAVD